MDETDGTDLCPLIFNLGGLKIAGQNEKSVKSDNLSHHFTAPLSSDTEHFIREIASTTADDSYGRSRAIHQFSYSIRNWRNALP